MKQHEAADATLQGQMLKLNLRLAEVFDQISHSTPFLVPFRKRTRHKVATAYADIERFRRHMAGGSLPLADTPTPTGAADIQRRHGGTR